MKRNKNSPFFCINFHNLFLAIHYTFSNFWYNFFKTVKLQLLQPQWWFFRLWCIRILDLLILTKIGTLADNGLRPLSKTIISQMTYMTKNMDPWNRSIHALKVNRLSRPVGLFYDFSIRVHKIQIFVNSMKFIVINL